MVSDKPGREHSRFHDRAEAHDRSATTARRHRNDVSARETPGRLLDGPARPRRGPDEVIVAVRDGDQSSRDLLDQRPAGVPPGRPPGRLEAPARPGRARGSLLRQPDADPTPRRRRRRNRPARVPGCHRQRSDRLAGRSTVGAVRGVQGMTAADQHEGAPGPGAGGAFHAATRRIASTVPDRPTGQVAGSEGPSRAGRREQSRREQSLQARADVVRRGPGSRDGGSRPPAPAPGRSASCAAAVR